MTGSNGNSQLLIFRSPPKRVVSLVPSMTESIFDLGAGQYLVGITEFCQVPEEARERLMRVGKAKSPQVSRIIELSPELVIANQEENRMEDIDALEAAGLKVWVTFPQTVDGAIKILWVLVDLFHVGASGSPRIRTLEITFEWTTRAAHGRSPVRVFCPIAGMETEPDYWWKTFNRETYAHDLLSHCGGLNIFADSIGRFPLEAGPGKADEFDSDKQDPRYPWVTPVEVLALDPEVILLPDEVQEGRLKEMLADSPAVCQGRVYQIEGSLISWHGTRLARALTELPAFLQPFEEERE